MSENPPCTLELSNGVTQAFDRWYIDQHGYFTGVIELEGQQLVEKYPKWRVAGIRYEHE